MENSVFSLLLAIVLALSLLTVFSTQGQRFNLPAQQPRSPDLQTDGSGRAYVSAGNQLYRLNSSLGLEEARELRSEVVNISLSSDGRWLVVCLTDLSCEVYNANNFSAGHVFRRENVITSTENIALFVAEDSFYVGSITTDNHNEGTQRQILLGQYGLSSNNLGIAEVQNNYSITQINFERNFYSGFIFGDSAYYFAIDSNPASFRGIRVMRVCHNSNFSALHELTIGCGGVAPTSNTRISGVSLVRDFAGLSGTTVVLSRSRPGNNQNYVCLYSLKAIDDVMQRKYRSCSSAGNESAEEIALAWVDPDQRPLCSSFQASEFCYFTSPLPLAVGDIENQILNVDFRVSVGMHTNPHFITASTTVTVDSFSFIYLAFIDRNNDSFVLGFNVDSSNTTLFEDSGFDLRSIEDGPVRQMEWLTGTNFIIAITNISVIRLPIVDCASQPNCTSCLGNGNPLCGWCVVENKCSRTSECQNSDDSGRWLQAARTNTDRCPAIASLSPQLYIDEEPQLLSLMLTSSLPEPLAGESFLCQFTSDGASFAVEAVGSGTVYTCNITGRISTEFSRLVSVPFITIKGAVEIYNCGATSSCSECLQTNNYCGWCKYNKVCSGTPDPCINGTMNYLQIDLGRNQRYTEVCPLLAQPSPEASYLHPVQTNRDIQLVTRNLHPEIDGFKYKCRVNGVVLPAVYNNETSLTCSVNASDLILPTGAGQVTAEVDILWTGENSRGEMIYHSIDNFTDVSVILYSCSELTSGCSSCTSFRLVEGFECGWCRRGHSGSSPSTTTERCELLEDCSNFTAVVDKGANCPAPVIIDFNPKIGPLEGGTTITITGRELGVSIDDFDSITVGNVLCTLVNSSYIPGRQVLCTTGTLVASTNSILIRLTTGHLTTSHELFKVATPGVYGVTPSQGPAAGGTRVTVWGTNLSIGNIEDTRIMTGDGVGCTVETVQADKITCTTLPLTNLTTLPLISAVKVLIDSATIINESVHFTYTFNPELYSVYPSVTIPAGGIKLVFSGTNLDVVQSPMLVFDDHRYLSTAEVTNCTVLNSTSITCMTPPLTSFSMEGDGASNDLVNYTVVMDNAPGPDLTAMESLRIGVKPNPGNFILLTTQYITNEQPPPFMVQIAGDNLDSVLVNEIHIAIGGDVCAITTVQTSSGLLYCIPPATPPEAISMATVKIFIGQHLEFTLNDTLNYGSTDTSISLDLTLALVLSIGSLLLLVIVISVVMLSVVLIYKKSRRKWIRDRDQSSEYNHLVTFTTQNSGRALFFANEEVLKQLPADLIIPSDQLQMFDNTIGQGEFGIIYEARLVSWRWYPKDMPVAVKRFKCLYSTSDVAKMLAEIAKMEDLRHPNVMSLIGVHLDIRLGLSIVMPFMANGSLLEYLKRERNSIYLDDSADVDTILSVNKLLQRICHQIAKGMEYLALRKFVHRDLAARNCMLDGDGNIKVGDFGLAEDVYVRGYFRQDKYDAIKVPYRWMAPESLRDGLFSEKSDVWSFGITCWEVFSGGRIPYPAVDAMTILKLHEKGTRLEKPANAACAPENFSIMVRCWALNPEDRSTFKQLNTTMDELLQTAEGYAEFSMSLQQPTGAHDHPDPGYHIIANQFTDSPVNQSPAVARAPAGAGADQVAVEPGYSQPGYSRLNHYRSTTATASYHHELEADSDLCTNDAYGGSMINIGLVMLQDETYTNEYSRTSHGNSGVALNECQIGSDSAKHSGGKVTVMMTDNAVYYTNLSQVTDV